MNNKIIVIEGTDGCGKQTQTQMLLDRLTANKISAVKQSFPNYQSLSSGPVKLYLDGKLSTSAKGLTAYQASSLYAVDRLCTIKEMEQKIYPESIVVFDRYVTANMLHQAGKISNIAERDRFLKWLDEFEFGTLLLPRPSQVIFLDRPVEMSKKLAASRPDLKTGMKKDIHESDEQHLIDSYNAGKYVAHKFGWTVIKCLNDKNELKPIEQIHEEIWQACFGKDKKLNAKNTKYSSSKF
ncbi:MAG: thymidylate kinase [Clostridia bacterium]